MRLENSVQTGIPGDGRCLFRSVVHGACLRAGKPSPTESLEKELADELRTKVYFNAYLILTEISRHWYWMFSFFFLTISRYYIVVPKPVWILIYEGFVCIYRIQSPQIIWWPFLFVVDSCFTPFLLTFLFLSRYSIYLHLSAQRPKLDYRCNLLLFIFRSYCCQFCSSFSER